MVYTTVHLIRHGEVYNPDRVLYGRLEGYPLSARGREMAERVASTLQEQGADIVDVTASPLLRAQQTATPIAEGFGLDLGTDERVIEAGNHFEGTSVAKDPTHLLRPARMVKLINPWKPSWGEPYVEVIERMTAAIRDARARAVGHEAVLVSHQLPIWTMRRHLEGRSMVHDPRKRNTTLASITSLTFDDGTLITVDYAEPCRDLLPDSSTAVLP
ncbi:histidine phosphatase family protein [Ruania alkalisoli]|uniref:Histidine phosphatase family protein n=1 Tax=Ruania alkalisoli TaxID=2779775 RepID=A0A7M1SSC6_9MICO|nr:histidine phosphatase family protein [Ruania alkalisoli]QOR70047.1 histidine phosphatase family protein [Ruania alkalisoli]